MKRITNIKKTRSLSFYLYILCGVFLLFAPDSRASASPFEETVRILEGRTAFHWGRDCFVWVVHYSEDLVDPWVEAEAGRVGMSESERDAYKSSFISDLSIGTAEPVLVTVHAFGASPLNLAPFSDKIALVATNGERAKPVRYDNVFDQPLSGVVQGLVFFPKQDNPDFAVAFSGLGVFDERIFAFSGEGPVFDNFVPPEDEEPEVVIVELPPAPVKTPPAPAPRPQRAPEPAPVPQPPAPQPAVPVPAPSAEPEPTEPAEPEVVVLEPEVAEVAYSSREQTLRAFLDHWIKFDPDAMYSMLSESSREDFSRREFEAELRKSSDFRNAIRDGYTIDWTGTDQGKVIVIRRFLFIRTLLSKTLGVTREGAAWKIVW